MQTVQEQTTGAGAKVGRRALLAVGAVGLCGASVIAAPYVGQRIQDAERAAVLAELGQIEGVSLDAAIRAAEITRAAVQTIVLPLARFIAFIGSGALGALLAAIDAARNALSVLHISSPVLDQFRVVVVSWQSGVTTLPIALDAYLTGDITSAETYLKTLKSMIARQQSSAIHL